jgi:DNA-binding NarL/FixJ family response regulator
MEALADLETAATASVATGRAALTVLIIDDEPHVRAFLRTALHSLGITQIHEAVNGAEGVARYQALQPSLVLLDVNMPVLGGEEAIQQIMAMDPEAGVIIVTSDCQHETVRNFLNLGACGYVLKHRPAAGVRAALDELLEGFVPIGEE